MCFAIEHYKTGILTEETEDVRILPNVPRQCIQLCDQKPGAVLEDDCFLLQLANGAVSRRDGGLIDR